MPDATLATLYLIFRKVEYIHIWENIPEEQQRGRFFVEVALKGQRDATGDLVTRWFWGDDLEQLIHKVWDEVNK